MSASSWLRATRAPLAPSAARPSRTTSEATASRVIAAARPRVTRCNRVIRSAEASAERRAACSAAWTWPFEMASATRRASSVVISISAGPYSRSGPTTKNIAPIVSPRAISGWTIALRASIAWMIPASAWLSAVWRARISGSLRSVRRIGRRSPTARAAGRGESAGGREVANPVEDRLVGCVLGHRGDPPEAPVGLDQVDDAEVGEIGDRQ